MEPDREKMVELLHFDGRRYFNPAAPAYGFRVWRVLNWMVRRRPQRWPKWIDDPIQPEPPATLQSHEIAATFVGQSTFLLQLDGVNVLTDPIWSERASPLRWAGPRRVRRPGLDFERLPPIHLVLVSHNHYDHMELTTLRRLRQRFDPLFVTGLGNRRYLHKRGIARVEELDWWQTCPAPGGLTVTMTPAQHFSRRGLFDRLRTLWGGFALTAEAKRVFFTGDSAYGAHFKEISRRLPGIDLALLPIGAYEPRWLMQAAHMNPEEAVRAHLDLTPRLSLGMHFGTFQLTDEAIDAPIEELTQSLHQHGIAESEFRVPGFGETIVVG
ncbi:MAG TPA: MBL fold metallo-hydrolase [Gemmataceae bacterium]|nr:MBL fold metallo-hydrolase [Gemmataceae bacterium]